MIAALCLLLWLYLVFARGRFWASVPELQGDFLNAASRARAAGTWPDVDIIVPARDEAETIHPVIASLLAQDYPGRYRVILVDDESSDATVARAGAAPGLLVIHGQPKPPGWSGKLWALSQGVAAARAPLLLLTDADITHDPGHLSVLVTRLEQPPVQMVSEMVKLNCSSLAEQALVPAFVYFFQMLYPFARVNDPHSSVA